MAVLTYTKTGNKATTSAKLDKSIFGVEVVSHELLKQAYETYLANGRTNNAHVLKRGEVSGGGRKPWRQKGTGRARFGSIRTPIWRGGGITFGPTGIENYSKKLNLSAKRQALRQALSLAAQTGKLSIIETFECKEGKVKTTIDLLNKVGVQGKVLLVVSQKDTLVERATHNLPQVTAIHAKYLNVFDIMNADSILMSQKALDIVHEWLGASTRSTSAQGRLEPGRKATSSASKEGKK
jgi:large subunit ribosomal protein L4